MSVDLDLINDYMAWRQNQALMGVKDTPADFAQYRENLERDERVEKAVTELSNAINHFKNLKEPINTDPVLDTLEEVYSALTGTDYEPDDV